MPAPLTIPLPDGADLLYSGYRRNLRSGAWLSVEIGNKRIALIARRY